MAFLDIFKRKKKENVGGMEDFMTLIRVYFQSVLASNLGISNLSALPDLLTFKRTQLSMLDQKQSCAVQTAAVNDGVPLHDLFPCTARQTLPLPGGQFVPAREKVFHFHGDPRLSCTYYTGVYGICQLYSYCQVRSKQVARVPNSLLTHCQAAGKKMQCRSCGRLVVGTKAPETCPVCNHPQSCFEVRKDNY